MAQEQEVIIYRNEQSYSSFPDVVRLKNRDLIACFREAAWPRRRPTHIDPTSRGVLVRSRDDGRTWDPSTRVVISPAFGLQDPSITQLSDGVLICNYFRWKVVPLSQKEELRGLGPIREIPDLGWAAAVEGSFIVRSRDNGYTWESPIKISAPSFGYTATSSPIVELGDGTLLAPLYGQAPSDRVRRSFVMKSGDGGESWGETATIAYDPSGTTHFHEPALCPTDGRIIAVTVYRITTEDKQGEYVYQSFSEDDGATWSPPKRTNIRVREGWVSSPHLLRLKSGNILCTYGYKCRPRGPYQIRAVLSHDDGETWDTAKERVLREGLGWDIAYSSSLQLEDETILTAYYLYEEDQVRYIAGSLYRE